MIALDYLTAIRFSGADAGDFLHNQLSSDVLALSGGESVFACYCEPKGRVLALMLVCRADEDYYVIMSSALAATVSARLRMYVMRSKVSIEVLDETRVAGLREHDAAEPSVVLNISTPLAGSTESLAILSHGTTANSNASSVDAWKASELAQGICWLRPETSAQFLPQMLGFDQLGAVNFRKGCYPGQEIVARTHYLGKVKRHPRGLHTASGTCPEPLEKIQILSNDHSYEAIVVDCGREEDDQIRLFVVTRMDPEMIAEQIEYQGQVVALA
jgi:folate-binding protein YgfZ